jgi:hypothetical protein
MPTAEPIEPLNYCAHAIEDLRVFAGIPGWHAEGQAGRDGASTWKRFARPA